MGIAVGIISAIATTVSGAMSAKASHDAGKEAKKIAQANAEMDRKQTAEDSKRLAASNARQQSLARARAAASGAGGESANVYLDALTKSGQDELDWLQEVGASQYNKSIAEGRIANSQAQVGVWGGVSQAGSGVASLFS